MIGRGLSPWSLEADIRFRCDRQPWSGLILDALDRWPRCVLLGPTQSGKTLLGVCAPVAYTLTELQEPVIILAPTIALAQNVWHAKIRPTIALTRYRSLLPTRGAHSRGGWTAGMTEIMIGQAPLRFIGAGGSDAQKSSFTARTVVVTEASQVAEVRRGSDQTSPLRQAEARTTAFADARFFLESVPGTVDGAEWKEYLLGTAQVIEYACPHCGWYQEWGRDQLVGWQDAERPAEAARLARMQCGQCGELVDDAVRGRMLRSPRLSEPQKDALTFSVRWNWFAASPRMRTMASVATKEWMLRHGHGDEDLARELAQFIWAVPYESDLGEEWSPEAEDLLSRVGVGPPKGAPPETVRAVTVGVDCHLRHLDWVAIAWPHEGTPWICDWSERQVYRREGPPTLAHLTETIRELAEEFRGWPRSPDLVLADAGWETDTVRLAAWGVRWLPCMGFPERQIKPKKGTALGPGWRVVRATSSGQSGPMLEVAVDPWKTALMRALGRREGSGALQIAAAPVSTRRRLAHHLTAEQWDEDRQRWRQRRGARGKMNHLLDAAVYACVAASRLGVWHGPQMRGRRRRRWRPVDRRT